MDEFRLPTRDAVQAAQAYRLGPDPMKVNIVETYDRARSYVAEPLSWPAHTDYDQPLRAAQIALDLISTPHLFATGRLICWAMAMDRMHPETQRMGLTVLFALEAPATTFLSPEEPASVAKETRAGVEILIEEAKLLEDDDSILVSVRELGQQAGSLIANWRKTVEGQPRVPFATWAAQTAYSALP